MGCRWSPRLGAAGGGVDTGSSDSVIAGRPRCRSGGSDRASSRGATESDSVKPATHTRPSNVAACPSVPTHAKVRPVSLGMESRTHSEALMDAHYLDGFGCHNSSEKPTLFLETNLSVSSSSVTTALQPPLGGCHPAVKQIVFLSEQHIQAKGRKFQNSTTNKNIPEILHIERRFFRTERLLPWSSYNAARLWCRAAEAPTAGISRLPGRHLRERHHISLRRTVQLSWDKNHLVQ